MPALSNDVLSHRLKKLRFTLQLHQSLTNWPLLRDVFGRWDVFSFSLPLWRGGCQNTVERLKKERVPGLSTRTEKSGHYTEVAISGGLTMSWNLTAMLYQTPVNSHCENNTQSLLGLSITCGL